MLRASLAQKRVGFGFSKWTRRMFYRAWSARPARGCRTLLRYALVPGAATFTFNRLKHRWRWATSHKHMLWVKIGLFARTVSMWLVLAVSIQILNSHISRSIGAPRLR